MRQEFIDLYDEFTHQHLDRRIFMARLAELAGGSAAAAALVPLLEANYANAAVVPPDDERLTIERLTIPAKTGELKGYLAVPKSNDGPMPGVVVVHENRGLNPHTEDVVRRTALAGFAALGPDFLSPAGGTPDDEDKARELINGLDQNEVIANAEAAVTYLQQREGGNGKAGIVGFCWGGGVVGRLATAMAGLNAGVVFYGRTPPIDQVPAIKAPLLLNYAGLDERINANVPAFEQALREAGVTYELHVYEGANHAFLNDTSAARYNPEAARLAWDRTVAFFRRTLA